MVTMVVAMFADDFCPLRVMGGDCSKNLVG